MIGAVLRDDGEVAAIGRLLLRQGEAGREGEGRDDGQQGMTHT